MTVFARPPELCGHRGSGRGVVDGALENTLGSFIAAAAQGIPWVEVDARRTADDVLVARHDPVVGDGRAVARLTGAQADELGLMRIDTLLSELGSQVAINVEVKSCLEDALRPRKRTTAALVARLLERERARRRLLVTSFDPAALLVVHELAPALPRGLLTWTRFPLRKAVPAAAHLGMDVVIAQVESFALAEAAIGPDAAEAVRVAHQAGLQVAAWCPESPAREALVEIGVDCLVIDDVPAALGAHQAVTGSSPASAPARRPSA